MPRLCTVLPLGPSNTGKLAVLKVNLLDHLLVALGAPHTNLPVTGESGRGNYGFTYDNYPAGYQGYAEVIDTSLDPDAAISLVAVNPTESLNADALSSDILELVQGPNGANEVEFTVTDSITAAPISNALITVRTAIGTYVDSMMTDLNGKAATALDNGSYLYNVTPQAGYSGQGNTTFSVADADKQISVSLNPISSTPPPSASLCTLEDYLQDGGGNAISAYTVEAFVSPLPQWSDGALIGGEKRTDVTDVNGYFSLFLVRGRSYLIKVPIWGVSHVFTIPDQATVTLRWLLENQAAN